MNYYIFIVICYVVLYLGSFWFVIGLNLFIVGSFVSVGMNNFDVVICSIDGLIFVVGLL